MIAKIRAAQVTLKEANSRLNDLLDEWPVDGDIAKYLREDVLQLEIDTSAIEDELDDLAKKLEEKK